MIDLDELEEALSDDSEACVHCFHNDDIVACQNCPHGWPKNPELATATILLILLLMLYADEWGKVWYIYGV